MATKAILAVCIILMGVCMSSGGSANVDETWQEVLTSAGTNVLFGPSNTYTIWATDSWIGYISFFFGLGFAGDSVRTDTTVTLSLNVAPSRIYACTDGVLQLVATNTSGTPQNALVRVRYNSTDGYYRLQITEASPAVYVQFVLLSQGGLRCTTGLPGTPIVFTSSPSSSSPNNPEGPVLVYTPNKDVLRQVVDSSSLA